MGENTSQAFSIFLFAQVKLFYLEPNRPPLWPYILTDVGKSLVEVCNSELHLFSNLVMHQSQFTLKSSYSNFIILQVTSSWESLVGYCYQYRDSTSSSIDNRICLRLNNLSLSRIGSIEKLLWVQMLDLSHNQLQSIEGIYIFFW